jgi:hypothetical protein
MLACGIDEWGSVFVNKTQSFSPCARGRQVNMQPYKVDKIRGDTIRE